MVRLLHGVPVVAVDTPSGVDVDTGELDGDARGRRPDRHLRHPQGRAPRRPGRGGVRGRAPGRHRARPARRRRSRRCRPRTSRPCCRGRRATRTSTPAASSGSGPGRRSTPAPACSPSPAPRAGWPGWCGTSATTPSPAMVREAHPEVVGAGRVQAWVVGSGSGDGAKGTLDEALADEVPLVVDADALAAPRGIRSTCRPCSRRTPASCAAMLGVEREDVEARPLRHVRGRGERYDAVVLLKGRRTLVARPDGAVRANPTGTALAGHRGRRRRPRRPGRRAAGGRPGAVRRRLGRLLAARRRGHAVGPSPADGPLVAGRRGERHPRGGPCRCLAARLSAKNPSTDDAPALARAEIVVDLAAIRHNVRALRRHVGPGVADDGRGQGRRLRPRHGRVRAGRPRRRRRRGSGVATLDEALALRDGRRHRPDPVLAAVPGEDYAAAIEADVDVTAYSVAELDEIVAAAGDRHARGCSSRSTPGLSRGGAPAGDWPALFAAAAGLERDGRITVTGVWSHFSSQRRARRPGERRAGGRLPGGARRGRAGRAPTRGAAPRQLGRRDPAAELAARPGAGRHRGVRPRPGARPHARPRPGPGDDGPGPPGDGQARRGGRRGLLRPDLDRRARDERSAWCPSGYGDGVLRVGRQHAPRSGSRRAPAGRGAGSAWTSSSSTSATPTRRRGRRRAVRPGRPRRADRAGLGRGLRHDQLRDRHQDRRPDGPAARRTRDTDTAEGTGR